MSSRVIVGALCLVLVMAGCGGSSSGPTPAMTIAVTLATQAPASLVSGATISLAALVTNDSSNVGVRWTVTCGSPACGSFSSAQTPSGGPTTFTAPAAVPTGNTVTVTATSVTDSTKSASAVITITAAPTISVTLAAQTPTSLVAGTTANLTATVNNDSANAGVNWTVTCGSSACGSFNPAQTGSGAATIFTAPIAVPSGNTVTVTATSVKDSTKIATATITITAPVPGISVTFASPPPMSLVAGATTSFTANLSNDGANAGVNWTVTCSSSACGSFSPTPTGSGVVTTFTAPAAVPTGGTVTVTATSVTDNTKSAAAIITITAPAPTISVTFALPPTSSLIAGATASLTANVSNDSANAGVNWTVICGSSACGSFNPAQTASGASTIFGAPSSVPTGNTVTVTATSVTDNTKSATATITIAPANGSPLADGTYVYHVAGYDANGPCFFAGAFTVVNSTITGGELDFSDSKAGYTNPLTPAASSLSYASVGSLQIVLATSNTNIGNVGVFTLHGAKSSRTRVLVTEFDGFATGTGSIDLQTSTAAPMGGYAFLISGIGFNTSGTALATALGGVLNISGTTVSTTASIFDVNFGFNNRSAQVFTAGSVSAPDSFGRISIGLTPDPNLGLADFILTGYVVGPNQIQLVESQQDNLGFNLAGMALAQGSNAGTFNQASVAGKTYVFGSTGADGNGVLQLAGTFAFGSTNAVSGSMAVNDLVAFGANTIQGGTYTVDATGRVTITNVTLSGITDLLAFQAYLDGNGNAMVMGADNVEATAGPAYLQTTSSPTVSGPYALASGGLLANSTGSPWSAAGPLTITSGNYSGFMDNNDAGTLTANVSLTGTTNSSTGVVSLTGLNALSFTGANSFANYAVDGNRVVSISVDSGFMSLGTLESVKQ